MVHPGWQDVTRRASISRQRGSSSATAAPSAGEVIQLWASRFAQSNVRSNVSVRRQMCTDGFVIGSWIGNVGTGNCLQMMLSGALVAAALDRAFVLNTNTTFVNGIKERDGFGRPIYGPRRRPFEASLTEAVSGIGGMAWLRAPRCVEDANVRVWDHPEMTTQASMRADMVRWCADAGVPLEPSDIGAVDLRGKCSTKSRHPCNVYDPDILRLAKDGGLCANLSRARIVVVHAITVANFEVLASHQRLAPSDTRRLTALSARGVNAYGLIARALWPDGLTQVGPLVERVSLAVHLRCWMNACSPKTLNRTARCLLQLVDSTVATSESSRSDGHSPLDAEHGPCTIYVASDHAGAAPLLGDVLSAARGSLGSCTILTAAHFRARLPPALAADVRSIRGKVTTAHASARHEVGGGSGTAVHPPPWSDPIDLEIMSNAHALVAVHVGALASTLAFVAGARAGRAFFIDPSRNHTCVSASTVYPSEPNGFALAHARRTAHYNGTLSEFYSGKARTRCGRPFNAGSSASVNGNSTAQEEGDDHEDDGADAQELEISVPVTEDIVAQGP